MQRRLWAAAKRQPGRRFQAQHAPVLRRDALGEAWGRVKANRGAAGVDGERLADVEAYGVERIREAVQETLKEGRYRAPAVLRRFIPEADGKKRPLGIPMVEDRVVQAAVKLVPEPIFEADFKESSCGVRPKRSATDALEKVRVEGARAGNHVLDADIRDAFGSITHDTLMKLASRRVVDRQVLKLGRQWVRAGILDDGKVTTPTVGTPQGGVISPLLANNSLNVLDAEWERKHTRLCVLVRYADDFVIACNTRAACEEAERHLTRVMVKLDLTLHPERTRRVDMSWGETGRPLPRVSLAEEDEPAQLGAAGEEVLLPEEVALDAQHEARAGTHPRADAARPMPRGPVARHQGTQPRAARVVWPLPNRGYESEVWGRGPVRRAAAERPAASTEGETPQARRVTQVDAGLLREPRAHPTEGQVQYPGAASMRPSETPPGSRMREIRTCGLYGGRPSRNGCFNPKEGSTTYQ
ncbi:MAG: hypothetical protein INH37_22365 [Myxococcaceae bacterium]|nr:hypothetical protein [Myxococcaceae bacterium]